MSYVGGRIADVISHPPQRATQYARPACKSAIPASTSSASRARLFRFPTLTISRRIRFPCGQSDLGVFSGRSMKRSKSKPLNMAQSPAKGAYAAATASSQQISSQAASATLSSSLWDRMRTTDADLARVSAKFRRNRMLPLTILGSTFSRNPPLPSSFPERSSSPAPITDQGDGGGTLWPFPHSHIYAYPYSDPRSDRTHGNGDCGKRRIIHRRDNAVRQPSHFWDSRDRSAAQSVLSVGPGRYSPPAVGASYHGEAA